MRGDGRQFRPRIAALPFSTGTPAAGLTLPLVDAGRGAEADFTRWAPRPAGRFVLIETEELHDIDGLFREYNEAVGDRAARVRGGRGGLVYMSPGRNDLLARHNASTGLGNDPPDDDDGAGRAPPARSGCCARASASRSPPCSTCRPARPTRATT